MPQTLGTLKVKLSGLAISGLRLPVGRGFWNTWFAN